MKNEMQVLIRHQPNCKIEFAEEHLSIVHSSFWFDTAPSSAHREYDLEALLL